MLGFMNSFINTTTRFGAFTEDREQLELRKAKFRREDEALRRSDRERRASKAVL